MSKVTKILIITFLLLLIGNYYVTAVSLNSSQINFKVRFSGEPEVSNKTKIKAAVTDDLSATINVNNLITKGETATATYIVQNTSTDLSANLSIETTNNNKEYFSLTSNIEKTHLKKGEATRVTITIQLIKEPILENEKATIGIQLKATPVQPTNDTDNNSNSENNDKTPSTTITNNNKTNINKESQETSIKKFYEKDNTPKTGDSSFINVFWR